MKPASSDPSGADRINATAAAWLVEEESGLSAEQVASFRQWCAEDSRHQAAVDRLRSSWSTLGRLRDYRPGARLHPDPDLLVPAPRPRFLSPAFASLGALTVFLLLLAFLRVSDRLPDLPWIQDLRYRTEAGGYNRVPLPDGSVMELNAESEVRVRFTDRQRLIVLMRGEGHFVVAPSAERPFCVETSGLRVKALGTEFNVRNGAHAIEVLVTHGRVALTAAGPAMAETNPPELTAGQRAMVADGGTLSVGRIGPIAINNVSADEIRAALAWQSPRLHFVDATLAEVVRQFNLRSSVQITVADPDLAKITLGGSFRPENVEGFVRLLASSNEVTIERPEPNQIVLRRTRRP